VPLRAPDVRQLAFDEHVRPVVFEREPDRAVDFRHPEYTFLAVMALTLKTLEERHLRHARTVAAINPLKKGTVSFLSECVR